MAVLRWRRPSLDDHKATDDIRDDPVLAAALDPKSNVAQKQKEKAMWDDYRQLANQRVPQPGDFDYINERFIPNKIIPVNQAWDDGLQGYQPAHFIADDRVILESDLKKARESLAAEKQLWEPRAMPDGFDPYTTTEIDVFNDRRCVRMAAESAIGVIEIIADRDSLENRERLWYRCEWIRLAKNLADKAGCVLKEPEPEEDDDDS